MDHPSSPSWSDKTAADSERTTPFSFLLEREPPAPPLLLKPARSAVPVSASRSLLSGSWIELAAIAIGALVVAIGAWSALLAGASFAGDRFLRTPVEGASLVAGPTFSSAPSLAKSAPLYATDTASTSLANGIMPAHISIPSIGVNADIVQVGKNAKGTMSTPPDYKTAAWYAPGSRPGAPGSAVMAGHLNNSLSMAGVFANLDKLKRGDTIIVSDAGGHTRTFTVFASEVYPVDKAPTDLIFTTLGPSQLALVTCDGAWNQGKKSFNERLVVYARLTSSS